MGPFHVCKMYHTFWRSQIRRDLLLKCSLSSFDHAAIARSLGCHGIRVEDPRQLAPALKEALALDKPTVIDVQTSLSESFRRVTSPLVS